MSMLVDCSNCKTPLDLPPGAKLIRCSVCQFITQIAESTQAPSPSGYSIFPGLEHSSSFNNHAPSSSGYSVFPGLQQPSSFNNHVPSPSGYSVFPGLQQSSSFNNHAPSSYKQAAPVPSGYQVHTPALTHSASFYSNYVPPAGYGRKKAVIVGVSYKNTRHELKGCINDANYMKHLLLTKFHFPESEIVMLTEEEADPKRIPTGRNMRAALSWLISGCKQGDSLLFHFSGHGSRQKNYNGDEIDGYDETLCPLDFETDGMIVDDEINATIVRPLPLGVKLHAIIDACHSGTVLDLPFLCRMSSTGHYEWEDHRPTSGIEKGTSGGEVISISGCDDDQTSADTSALSKITSTGAMTFCFIEAIEHGNASTYGSLLSSMRNAIRNASRGVGGGYGSRGFSQEPQLTSCEQFDMYSKRFEL